jgi:hypothetical protein
MISSATQITPDLQACLLCEDVRAELNGQQSIVGIIAAIPAPTMPIGFFKLCLWTRWCAGQGKFRQRSLIVSSQDERILAESQVEFSLQQMDSHATNVHVFGGLKFEHWGMHNVEVYLDDELRLRFPLPVVRVNPPN